MEEQRKLTRKMELFCQEYIVDYNGTKAAIRAGYEERSARSTASKLLAKSNVRSRVRELQAEQVERMAATQDFVVQQLIETYQKCCEPTPVMVWDNNEREYVPKGTYEFDSKGATKALELLGRHLGMFTDHVAVKVKTPIFEGEADIAD